MQKLLEVKPGSTGFKSSLLISYVVEDKHFTIWEPHFVLLEIKCIWKDLVYNSQKLNPTFKLFILMQYSRLSHFLSESEKGVVLY